MRPERSRSAAPVAHVLADIATCLILPVLLTGALYLLPFIRDPALLPFGADTKSYIVRADTVRAEGIDGLAGDESSIAERPTASVFTATVTGLTGMTPFTFAWLSPAVVASIIALAAGTFASEGLGEPRRRALAYAVGVGCSAFVAWTAYGYAANLLVDPLIVALFLAAAIAASTGRGRVAGGVLLLGSVFIHWVFAALAAALVLVFAAFLALAARREGPMRPRAGAARDVASILLGGVAGVAIALGVAPSLPGGVQPIGPGDRGGVLHAANRLPGMRLGITGPLAAAGLALWWVRAEATRRWRLVLLLVWASLVPLSLVGWFMLGLPTPPYRLAGFALAIPLLCVAAASRLGDIARRHRPRAGASISLALVLACTLGLAAAGADVWWTAEPKLQADKLGQLGTVASYLATQPTDLEVLVLVPPTPAVPIDQIRVGLPANATDRVQTLITDDPEAASAAVEGTPGTAVVWLASFGPRTAPPGTLLGPGVVLIEGPAPAGPITPGEAPRAPSPARMIWLSLVAIGALGLAGSGWAQLLGVSRLGRISLMPTFGLAMLGVVGLLLSRAGVPFDRVGSVSILLATTAAGWAVVALGGLRRTPTDRGADLEG